MIDSGLIGSRHFPVTALLTAPPAPLPPKHEFVRWCTEKASNEQIAAFVLSLSSFYSENAIIGENENVRQKLITVMKRMKEYSLSSFIDINDKIHQIRSENYRHFALAIADEAWSQISFSLKSAAKAEIGEEKRNKGLRPGWTKALRALHRNALHSERRARKCRYDPVLRQQAAGAQRAFNAAVKQANQEHWRKMAAAIEASDEIDDTDEAKAERKRRKATQPVWKAVKRLANALSSTPPLSAGLRRPDGSLTATAAESAAALADHFRQQLSPHSPFADENDDEKQQAIDDDDESQRRNRDLLRVKEELNRIPENAFRRSNE